MESYEYDAFGRIKVFDSDFEEIPESAYGNRITFQGREYSWATGLYYFRARWYEPVTGRWLSKDPIGISGGLNQYVAFGGNGVIFVDPDGLATIWLNGKKFRVKTFEQFNDVFEKWDVARNGRISNFHYLGHGDLDGGFVLGGDERVDAAIMYQYLHRYGDKFDPSALFELEGCGTMNPFNEGGRVADEIRDRFPDADIWGFTGLIGPKFLFFGPHVGRPNNSYWAGKSGRWSPFPDLPAKSEWKRLD